MIVKKIKTCGLCGGNISVSLTGMSKRMLNIRVVEEPGVYKKSPGSLLYSGIFYDDRSLCNKCGGSGAMVPGW